jgi:hypothetical protein
MESFYTLERQLAHRQREIEDEIRRNRMLAELRRGSEANRTTLRHRLTTLLLDPLFSSRRRTRSLNREVAAKADSGGAAAAAN